MDLSPEYVAASRELDAKMQARSKFHRWIDGEYYWCPEERRHGIYVAEGEQHDHMHEDDAWLPRLDQLFDLAESLGIVYVGLLSATTGYSAVGTTGRQVGDGVEQQAASGATREQAIARLILAAL